MVSAKNTAPNTTDSSLEID